jgi:hypothetical protein
MSLRHREFLSGENKHLGDSLGASLLQLMLGDNPQTNAAAASAASGGAGGAGAAAEIDMVNPRQWYNEGSLGESSLGNFSLHDVLLEGLTDVTMHEVGHTLGLRHNFVASTAIPFAQLSNSSFTRVHGLSDSVMDYVPLNIQSNLSRPWGPHAHAVSTASTSNDDGVEGVHYFMPTVGRYDVAAVRYGYAVLHHDVLRTKHTDDDGLKGGKGGQTHDGNNEPVNQLALHWARRRQEKSQLDRLAALVPTFQTDEDVSGTGVSHAHKHLHHQHVQPLLFCRTI